MMLSANTCFTACNRSSIVDENSFVKPGPSSRSFARGGAAEVLVTEEEVIKIVASAARNRGIIVLYTIPLIIHICLVEREEAL